MPRIAIIGAGIAGSYLAHKLKKIENVNVEVFEKSRGVGGRLCQKRVDYDGVQWSFLHGSPVIDLTQHKDLADEAVQLGCVKRGTPDWQGIPSVNSYCKSLLQSVPVITGKEIKAAVDLKDYDWVVSTAPGPQTHKIFALSEKSSQLQRISYEPAFVWMIILEKPIEQLAPKSVFLKFEQQEQKQNLSSYVVRISKQWTQECLENETEVNEAILANEFKKQFPNVQLKASWLHRWRYSVLSDGLESYWIDEKNCWAACGDSFEGGQIGGSLMSAKKLFNFLASHLSTN